MGNRPEDSNVDPSTIHQGLPADRHYSIFASPALISVTKGAVIRYTLLFDGFLTTIPMIQAPGSDSPSGDRYTWYKFADRAVLKDGDAVPIQRGEKDGLIVDAGQWDCEWNEKPGRYIIGCRIYHAKHRTATWCFYAQYVVDVETVLTPMLEVVRQNGLTHPDQALAKQARNIKNINDDAVRLPPSTPALRERHEKQLKDETDYLNDLRAKIEPWQGKEYLRFPVVAKHLTASSQTPVTLNVYLVKKPPTRDRWEPRGDREVRVGVRCEWLLVDYTIPGNKKVCQEASGFGASDEAAIRNAFSGWNLTGNRYPGGWIKYSVVIKDIAYQGTFETNGRTAWDTLTIGLNLLATAGMVVVGVAALFCPVPGAQVVSFALWTSIFSSTAAATINIAQNIDEGSGTWQDYAIDGLTIVSNILAGAGQLARVAATAKAAQGVWTEASVVRMAGEMPGVRFTSRAAAAVAAGETAGTVGQVSKAAKWLLIGQIATDAVQGILIAESYIKEYREVLENPNITPKERLDRLLSFIGRAVMDGGLIYISIRGSVHELSSGKKQNKYLKQKENTGSSEHSSGDTGGEKGKTDPGEKNTSDDTQREPNPFKDDEPTQVDHAPLGDKDTTNPDGAPVGEDDNTWDETTGRYEIAELQAKLEQLAKRDAEITIRAKVPTEGHTNPKKTKEKNLHTEHETTARTQMRYDTHDAPRKPTLKERLDATDPDIWCDPPGRPLWADDEIRLLRKMPGREGSSEFQYSKDFVFWARNRKGYLHVEIVRTVHDESVLGADRARSVAADPESGLVIHPGKDGNARLYCDELNAKELYPAMFDHFEQVAKRNKQPIKGIDGQFAFENMGEIVKALEDPKIRAKLVIDEFSNGNMELRPEALQYSKTWRFWEDYARKYGYKLVPDRPVLLKPEEGVYWGFKLTKS